MPTYRVDFHHHTNSDPIDTLWYSARDLVDRAVLCGIHAIAVTPHGAVFDEPKTISYAQSKGILLIPGVEKMVEGKEVLLLNVTPSEVSRHFSFEDLRRLRQQKGLDFLSVAPHPFYPRDTCMGPWLDRYRDLMDAVEYAHFHLEGWNPNDQLLDWARSRNCPVLANSDTHYIGMMGRNWSEVEAESLTTRAIFDAIRAGRVRVRVHRPSLWEVFRFAVQVSAFQDFLRVVNPRRTRAVRALYEPSVS